MTADRIEEIRRRKEELEHELEQARQEAALDRQQALENCRQGPDAFESLRAYHDAVVAVGWRLIEDGEATTAIPLLAAAQEHGRRDYRIWEALADAYKRTKQRAAEADIRARMHKSDISRARKSGDVYTFLEKMAVSEKRNLYAPSSAAEHLRAELAHEPGRERLAAGAGFLLERYPDSVLLLYVRSVALAKLDRSDVAYRLVNSALRRNGRTIETLETSEEKPGANKKELEAAKALGKRLSDLWIVVDHVARQNMAWAADDDTAPESMEDEGNAATALPVTNGGGSEHDPQRRNMQREKRRLETLRQQFREAGTLRQKLDIVGEVMRLRGRPLPDYRPTFRLAGQLLDEIAPVFESLTAGLKDNQQDYVLISAREIPMLVRMYRLAERLEKPQIMAAIRQQIARILQGTENDDTRLTALQAIPDLWAPDDSKRFIRRLLRNEPTIRRATRVLQWCMATHDGAFARAVFNRLPESLRTDPQLAWRMATFHEWDGSFNKARTLVLAEADRMLTRPQNLLPQKHWRLAIERAGELEFAQQTADYLRRFSQPQAPKGIIFVAPRKLTFLRSDPLVVLMELRKQGWAVVPLVEGTVPADPTGDPEIDALANVINRSGYLKADLPISETVEKEFTADMSQGVLKWRDVDLSHPMYELATVRRRSYSIDFTCPTVHGHLAPIIPWVQSFLTIMEHLRDLGARKDLRIGFLCGETHILPNAVFRHYCEKHGDPERFFCVQSVNAYENYFSNFKSNVSTRLSLRNLTATPHLRTPFLPEPKEFEAWYQANRAQAPEFLREVEHITGMRRSTGEEARPPEAEACLQRIDEWRARGGKVACLFGKVPCDLAVPYDGGPAHASMKDWLNHSIAAARAAPDTLLLVKPHPHELKVEIGLFLTEFFTDLIEEELPENVIVLGHRWFDMNDMNGRIDLGLLYNGTTAVELGVMGIPAILCSDFGPTDYPVGHAVPRDRGHYERMVRFEEKAEVAADLKERSAAWLKFLSSDEVSVPYRYYARQVTNRVIHPTWWFEEDIERYLAEGDPHVERLAAEITRPGVDGSRAAAGHGRLRARR